MVGRRFGGLPRTGTGAVVKLLLAKGADVEAMDKDYGGTGCEESEDALPKVQMLRIAYVG